MSQKHKLEVLRAKTDRDLLILMRRELERGLTLAGVATTKYSPLYAQAERAYENVKALLPLIWGLRREERRELEFGLLELRVALDRLSSEQADGYVAVA